MANRTEGNPERDRRSDNGPRDQSGRFVGQSGAIASAKIDPGGLGSGPADPGAPGAPGAAPGAPGVTGKRKPGRPAKLSQAESAPIPAAEPVAATVTPVPPKPKLSHAKGAGKASQAAARLADASKQAESLIGVLESMCVTVAGPEAALTYPERAMLALSLPQLLANLKPEVIERTQAIAYPLILAAGLGIYGYRVYGLVEAKAASRKAEAKRKAETPAAWPGPDPAPAPVPPIVSGNGLGEPDSRDQFGGSIRGVP